MHPFVLLVDTLILKYFVISRTSHYSIKSMLLRDLKLILSNRKAIGYVSDVDVFVRLGSKPFLFFIVSIYTLLDFTPTVKMSQHLEFPTIIKGWRMSYEE